MKFISVDIEADGPIPGKYSMIELGAVYIDPEGKLDQTFYGTLKPLSMASYTIEALQSIGSTHEQTLEYSYPEVTMLDFDKWLSNLCKEIKPHFMSDNAGFDWMFVCWYFHTFLGRNPFGFSSLSLTSLYKGISKDFRGRHKKFKKTKHTHNPVDDAKGNAEALIHIVQNCNFKIKLE